MLKVQSHHVLLVKAMMQADVSEYTAVCIIADAYDLSRSDLAEEIEVKRVLG
jgi:hypothetical protein